MLIGGFDEFVFVLRLELGGLKLRGLSEEMLFEVCHACFKELLSVSDVLLDVVYFGSAE